MENTRTILTNAELQELITNCNGILEIEDKIFEEPFEIRDAINFTQIKFLNCELNFTIQNVVVESKITLRFNRCYFSNLYIGSCRNANNSEETIFDISQCSFKKIIFLMNSFRFSLTFETCKFEELIEIVSNKSSLSKVQFRDATDLNSSTEINADVKISGNSLNSLSMSGKYVFSKDFAGSFNEITNIHFTYVRFLRSVHLYGTDALQINFNRCQFDESLHLSPFKVTVWFVIENCKFNQQVRLLFLQVSKTPYCVKDLEIISSIFEKGILLETKSSKINTLKMEFTENSEGEINILNSTIDKVLFKGINESSNIEIKDSVVENVEFNNFYNYSNIQLNKLRIENLPYPTFKVIESNLGETKFMNFNFKNYQSIEINNSNLTETTFANVTWFKKEQINAESKDHKNSREVFRQLKYSLEKQGNKIDALYFKALEMDVYQKELIVTEKSDWKDKWIMCFNSTNDFGLNWVKPALFLLGGSLVFFILIVIGVEKSLSFLPNFSCQSICQTPEVFINNLKHYPRLLDPTHSLDKIFIGDDYDVGFWANAFSYILKIYLAFFIFQTIKAFRKFAE